MMKMVKSSKALGITLVFVMIAMLSMAIPLSTAPVSAQGVQVSFPDPNLDRAIREAIDKPSGPIYVSELQELTSFNASDMGISDLSGMEYCTNLSVLDFYNNKISNLSPLSDLTSLTTLWLGGNQISDITPLSFLTNLNTLGLTQNRISNLSPLSSLSNLKELYLTDNEISDIFPLSSLSNLTTLWIGYNRIDDITRCYTSAIWHNWV